jgi:hypothetical protein
MPIVSYVRCAAVLQRSPPNTAVAVALWALRHENLYGSENKLPYILDLNRSWKRVIGFGHFT